MWIADLMQFHRVSYYVGLLTAAAMYGAAHQQPQEFQVVAGAILRPIVIARVRIRFFFRREMNDAITQPMKASNGYIPTSTPEMTTFDLVRYRKSSSSIDHIATVISDLSEQLEPRRLEEVANRSNEAPVIQRLGFLLDAVQRSDLAEPLVEWIRKKNTKYVPLEPGNSLQGATRNSRWRILVNTSIEVES